MIHHFSWRFHGRLCERSCFLDVTWYSSHTATLELRSTSAHEVLGIQRSISCPWGPVVNKLSWGSIGFIWGPLCWSFSAILEVWWTADYSFVPLIMKVLWSIRLGPIDLLVCQPFWGLHSNLPGASTPQSCLWDMAAFTEPFSAQKETILLYIEDQPYANMRKRLMHGH